MLIEAALNGGRTRAEHPGVPCSPEEMAAAAREAVAAGAGAAHFHVRGAGGRESVDADDLARAVSALVCGWCGMRASVMRKWRSGKLFRILLP
jgi:uncharacterized protein (DUF849 family)